MKHLLIALALVLPIAPAGARDLAIGLWDENWLPGEVKISGASSVAGQSVRSGQLTFRLSADKLSAPGVPSAASMKITSSQGLQISTPGGVRSGVRGVLRLTARDGGIQGVVTMDLEEYVSRVVGREMPPDWPAHALAAQAVAARSYALAQRRHAREGYDLCSLTHCQLWSLAPPHGPARSAARQTAGYVLTRGGQTVAAPYSSTCGGQTAAGDSVGMESWLQSVHDGPAGAEYCRASSHFFWRTTITPEEVRKVLGVDIESVGELGVERAPDWRVRRINMDSKSWTGMEFMLAFGREIGWNRVKSPRFGPLVQLSAEKALALDGKGLGHGAGMCQWGARGRALKGQTWRQILEAYYPGTVIRKSTR